MAAQGSGFEGRPVVARKFNVDLLAIGIALALAGLIRFNVIGHIGF